MKIRVVWDKKKYQISPIIFHKSSGILELAYYTLDRNYRLYERKKLSHDANVFQAYSIAFILMPKTCKESDGKRQGG